MDLRERFERDYPPPGDADIPAGAKLYAMEWQAYQAGHAARDAEIAELLAKVEAAERDAARMRFIALHMKKAKAIFRREPNEIRRIDFSIDVDFSNTGGVEAVLAAIDAARDK